MKLLDKYILRELFKLFLAVLFVISIAFVIQRLIFLTEWSMHRGIGMLGVMKLLLCLFPGLFLTAIPLVCLFTIIVVLSQMSEENQLVVMMSCGRDLGALAKPILKFALACTVLTCLLSFFLAPAAVRKFEVTRWELIQAKSEKAIPTQRFIEFSGDTMIYVQGKDNRGLQNVIIYKGSPGEGIFSNAGKAGGVVFAKQGRLLSGADQNQGLIYLQDGVFLSHEKKPLVDLFLQFEKAYARLDFSEAQELEQKLKTQTNTASFPDLLDMYLNVSEFATKEKHKKEMGLGKQLRIELAQRLSQVLSCLLLSLWGIGLGIKPPRTSRTISYVLGVLAGFGYYYLNVLFKALALKKLLPIELALWAPAVLILITGCLLLWRRMKGHEPLNFLYQFDEYVRQWRVRRAGTGASENGNG